MTTTIYRRTLGGLLLVLLLPLVNAHAQVKVAESDVVKGKYTFTLKPEEIKSGQCFDTHDIKVSNLEQNSEGADQDERIFVRALEGKTSAELVLAFDFSGLKQFPVRATVTDCLYLFDLQDDSPWQAAQDVEAFTEWSIDGANYEKIRTVSTVGTEGNKSSAGNQYLEFPRGAEKVFYRVRFQAADNGKFIGNQNQWARSAPDGEPFKIVFQTEPSR